MGVSRVDVGGRTLIDLTGDSVNPQSLLKGVTAHGKDGEAVEGTLDLSSSRTLTSISVTAPVKDTYEVGEALDLSGVTVMANYESTEDVTRSANFAPVNGQELTQAGTITVSVSYTEGGITKTAETAVTVKSAAPPVKIVTWTDGTDEEIATMLDAHYAGVINIHDFWTVGDERKVQLSAMEGIPSNIKSEIHDAQEVTMVLMNAGGKTLENQVNGIDECAFIVGQKDCLVKEGRIDEDTDQKWLWCERRKWCNDTYRNAFPIAFKGLFKQHINFTASEMGSSVKSRTVDYFALPSEKEVFGTTINANETAEENNTQFSYYEIVANRVKKKENYEAYWWTRSLFNAKRTTKYFCCINKNGSSDYFSANSTCGISPFGCI